MAITIIPTKMVRNLPYPQYEYMSISDGAFYRSRDSATKQHLISSTVWQSEPRVNQERLVEQQSTKLGFHKQLTKCVLWVQWVPGFSHERAQLINKLDSTKFCSETKSLELTFEQPWIQVWFRFCVTGEQRMMVSDRSSLPEEGLTLIHVEPGLTETHNSSADFDYVSKRDLDFHKIIHESFVLK